jgi:hypothetical protein
MTDAMVEDKVITPSLIRSIHSAIYIVDGDGYARELLVLRAKSTRRPKGGGRHPSCVPTISMLRPAKVAIVELPLPPAA